MDNVNDDALLIFKNYQKLEQYFKFQMQKQAEIIKRQLLQLRKQCLSLFLTQKLSTFLQPHQLENILHQLLTFHQQQFITNIAENITHIKHQNKKLKLEIQTLHQQYSQKIEQNTLIIKEQCQQTMIPFTKIIEFLELTFPNTKEYIAEIQNLFSSLQQIQTKILEVQQKYSKQNTQTQNIYTIKVQELLQNSQNQRKNFEKLSKDKQNQFENLILKTKIQIQEQFELILKEKQINLQNLIQKQRIKCQQMIQQKQKERQIILKEHQALKIQLVANHQEKMSYKLIEKENTIKIEQLLSENQIYFTKLETTNKNNLSLENSIKYMQEQNNYLRQKIQHFEQKFHESKLENKHYLEKIKNIQNKINELNENKEELIEKNEELLIKHETQLTKIEQYIKITNELEQKNMMLHEQIKVFQQYCEINEEQSEKLSEQIIKIQKLHRENISHIKQYNQVQIEALRQEIQEQRFISIQKETETTELNQLNQQFIEQIRKYKHIEYDVQQLQRQNIFYKEIKIHQKISVNAKKKSKVLYMLANICEEFAFMKETLQNMRGQIENYNAFYKRYVNELISSVVGKVMKERIQCSYCQHKEALEKQKLREKQKQRGRQKDKENEEKLKKIMVKPDQLKHDSKIYSKIKKNVDYVNRKYNNAQEQSKNFHLHLDHLLNS